MKSQDEFVELIQASAPSLRSAARFLRFVATHPKALRTMRTDLAALRSPASYATVPYYAIHAFKWVDADDGERYVRYRWVPDARRATLSPRAAKRRGRDYLHEELRERLAREPIRFSLELQVAAPDDDVDDPSAIWPRERERFRAGAVEVTAVADDAPDAYVYDPLRLTDGIEPSNDPILNFRPRAYAVSAERRSA